MKDHKILFFGNGASKCKAVINGRHAMFLDDIVPKALHLGEMAFKKYQENEFEDLLNFEPNYLKEFLIKPPKAVL
jgi:tRNA threonylcarbamoyladenosine biosynthesis protein TsaB